MIKVETAKATKLQLDWGLAKALELIPEISRPSPYDGSTAVLALPLPNGYPRHHKCGFFHTDPAVCMGLIERCNLDVNHRDPLRLGDSVLVSWGDPNDFAYGYWSARGKTLAEAVARCIISMKLGDEFEVPDDLG